MRKKQSVLSFELLEDIISVTVGDTFKCELMLPLLVNFLHQSADNWALPSYLKDFMLLSLPDLS